MIIYWPNAIYLDKNGEEQRLFTYDGALNYDKAIQAIRVWKEEYHYNLIRAWIDAHSTKTGPLYTKELNIEHMFSDELKGT